MENYTYREILDAMKEATNFPLHNRLEQQAVDFLFFLAGRDIENRKLTDQQELASIYTYWIKLGMMLEKGRRELIN